MKSIVVTIILINTLVYCIPIEILSDNSEIEHFSSVNFTNSDSNETFDESKNNISKISMPNDVEFIGTGDNKSEQQTVLPLVGSLIEMIFAVNHIYIHFTFVMD